MQNVSDLAARLEAADKKIQLLQTEIKAFSAEDLVSDNEILKVCAAARVFFTPYESEQFITSAASYFRAALQLRLLNGLVWKKREKQKNWSVTRNKNFIGNLPQCGR